MITFLYDCLNKQSDCPIAEQDEVKQKSQTENEVMRMGPVQLGGQQDGEGSYTKNGMEVKVTSLGETCGLVKMGLSTNKPELLAEPLYFILSL